MVAYNPFQHASDSQERRVYNDSVLPSSGKTVTSEEQVRLFRIDTKLGVKTLVFDFRFTHRTPSELDRPGATRHFRRFGAGTMENGLRMVARDGLDLHLAV